MAAISVDDASGPSDPPSRVDLHTAGERRGIRIDGRESPLQTAEDDTCLSDDPAVDLRKAAYTASPLEDGSLSHWRVVKVPINKL